MLTQKSPWRDRIFRNWRFWWFPFAAVGIALAVIAFYVLGELGCVGRAAEWVRDRLAD